MASMTSQRCWAKCAKRMMRSNDFKLKYLHLPCHAGAIQTRDTEQEPAASRRGTRQARVSSPGASCNGRGAPRLRGWLIEVHRAWLLPCQARTSGRELPSFTWRWPVLRALQHFRCSGRRSCPASRACASEAAVHRHKHHRLVAVDLLDGHAGHWPCRHHIHARTPDAIRVVPG